MNRLKSQSSNFNGGLLNSFDGNEVTSHADHHNLRTPRLRDIPARDPPILPLRMRKNHLLENLLTLTLEYLPDKLLFATRPTAVHSIDRLSQFPLYKLEIVISRWVGQGKPDGSG